MNHLPSHQTCRFKGHIITLENPQQFRKKNAIQSDWQNKKSREQKNVVKNKKTGLTQFGCFQKIMVTPNHPFGNRVFHYKHHPFWGIYPNYFWKHLFPTFQKKLLPFPKRKPSQSPKGNPPMVSWVTSRRRMRCRSLGGSPSLGDGHIQILGVNSETRWMFPKIVGFPPKSSGLIGVFHYKPSILGVSPLFLETPRSWRSKIFFKPQKWSIQMFCEKGHTKHLSRSAWKGLCFFTKRKLMTVMLHLTFSINLCILSVLEPILKGATQHLVSHPALRIAFSLAFAARRNFS